jgi:hypothetical protein
MWGQASLSGRPLVRENGSEDAFRRGGGGRRSFPAAHPGADLGECAVHDASRIERAGPMPKDAAIVGTHDVSSAPGAPVARA